MTTPDLTASDSPTSGSEATPPPPPQPGEIGHFCRGGHSYMRDHRETSGAVSVRGEEFTVTEAMIEANRDPATGVSWLDLLHDPEAQRRIGRAGRLLCAPGPWPGTEERTEPGTPEHADARREAQDAARAIPDKTERAEAMRRVNERFGPAGATSSTLASYPR